jgi:hypothetical protein
MSAMRQVVLFSADVHPSDARDDARAGISEQPFQFTLHLKR